MNYSNTNFKKKIGMNPKIGSFVSYSYCPFIVLLRDRDNKKEKQYKCTKRSIFHVISTPKECNSTLQTFYEKK